ncbi:MAG: DUF2125 domain-containing protein [Rhizobiaceae bacterium]
MASTGKERRQAGAPNFGRRIKWLGAVFVIAMLVWTGVWFYLAQLGEKQVDKALTHGADRGQIASCENRAVKGYPFRFGLFCDSVHFEDAAQGLRLSASALRTAAQFYNPWQLVAELDGPARIDAPGLKPLEINWSLLHASARANTPLPDRVSLEGKDIDVSIRGEAGAVSRAIVTEYAAAHMRVEGKDVAFAAESGGTVIDPAVTPGRTIPAFSFSYDVVLKNGVQILGPRPKDLPAALRGSQGEIRSAILVFKDGGEARATGPISTDATGLVNATITFAFKDAEKLGAALGKAMPESASTIAAALSGAAVAAGKDKDAGLTLTIRKGKVSIGLFPIAQIPAL